MGVTWLTTTTFILRICRITGPSLTESPHRDDKTLISRPQLSPSQIEFKTGGDASALINRKRRIKNISRFINDISNIISDKILTHLQFITGENSYKPSVRDIGWIKTTKNSPDVGLIRPTIFPRGINSFEWKRGEESQGEGIKRWRRARKAEG